MLISSWWIVSGWWSVVFFAVWPLSDNLCHQLAPERFFHQEPHCKGRHLSLWGTRKRWFAEPWVFFWKTQAANQLETEVVAWHCLRCPDSVLVLEGAEIRVMFLWQDQASRNFSGNMYRISVVNSMLSGEPRISSKPPSCNCLSVTETFPATLRWLGSTFCFPHWIHSYTPLYTAYQCFTISI